ncbi:hypothetical protein [Paraburkholderia humisilvae]|uniref:hypothetical protein n=1 Tax=Paraburkholderia humisilvae TaxID=627669 RepID=UPI001581A9E1
MSETVSKHEATLGQRDAINGAAAARDDAQVRIGREEAKLEPLQAVIADLEQKQLSLTSLTSGLKGLESDGTSKLTLLRSLDAQAGVIAQVPCSGHEMHATCPLLTQAREAGAKASEHRVSLESLRERFRMQRAEADLLGPQVQQLPAKREALKAVNDSLKKARQDLQNALDLAARKPLLDAATEGLPTARNDLQTLDAEESDARQRRETETARLTLQLQEVDAELARLAAVDVTATIEDIDRQLTTGREAVTAADAQIEALIRAQATRQAERDALEKDLSGFDATQSRAGRISDEIVRWKLLAKGLGSEGVIALTIDDAGPALTQMVNDLLLACYGSRFTVEIRTQRELSSGELREGFEILVHDADNDSIKAVTVMSGGQKVWINECLTRGIALYLAGNAGQPYQTLFSDESDGPLDPERKLQFMRMKREVLKQGGYQREFFISQTPDLVAEADAVIDVEALAV